MLCVVARLANAHWRECKCKISWSSAFPAGHRAAKSNTTLFPREAFQERRCLGAPSLSALLFFDLITKSVTQTPWKPHWTQKPSLTSACGSRQGHRGVIMVCQSGGGDGGFSLLFLTFKGESEKSLTLGWSQAGLKIAANHQHMCRPGKNINDRRLLFASSARSHATAVLFSPNEDERRGRRRRGWKVLDRRLQDLLELALMLKPSIVLPFLLPVERRIQMVYWKCQSTDCTCQSWLTNHDLHAAGESSCMSCFVALEELCKVLNHSGVTVCNSFFLTGRLNYNQAATSRAEKWKINAVAP